MKINGSFEEFSNYVKSNYDINDIRSSLFSVLHEGGHALYEQNINPKLVGTRLNTGASMGIHESQSRFYENIIGRNLSFWKKHYNKVCELLPSYSNISLDKFYNSIALKLANQNKKEVSISHMENNINSK